MLQLDIVKNVGNEFRIKIGRKYLLLVDVEIALNVLGSSRIDAERDMIKDSW